MIPWLSDNDTDYRFPPLNSALDEPNGLLAAGGDLSPGRLLAAYAAGVFPWFSDNDPIMWWSPDPRMVLYPERVNCSRRLARTIASGRFTFTLDQDFQQVIQACAEPREHQAGTWITESMIRAYRQLHVLGHAHSLEVREKGVLVAGIYGIAIGRVFFGESMFHRRSNASKIALVWLCQLLQHNQFGLLDCQVESGHLGRMGAENIPRSHFESLIQQFCAESASIGDWHSPRLPVELARYFQQD
jgi:leucyl/phenylalanyl-tRNA--protein transferase